MASTVRIDTLAKHTNQQMHANTTPTKARDQTSTPAPALGSSKSLGSSGYPAQANARVSGPSGAPGTSGTHLSNSKQQYRHSPVKSSTQSSHNAAAKDSASKGAPSKGYLAGRQDSSNEVTT